MVYDRILDRKKNSVRVTLTRLYDGIDVGWKLEVISM